MFAVALCMAPSFSFAQVYYLSQPGLCDADDGAVEESDALILTDMSLGNHYGECSWDVSFREALKTRATATIEARCQDSSKSWDAELVFSRGENRQVLVFGGGDPAVFFPCE